MMALLRPDNVLLSCSFGRRKVKCPGYTLTEACARLCEREDLSELTTQVLATHKNNAIAPVWLTVSQVFHHAALCSIRWKYPVVPPKAGGRPLIVSRRMKEVINSWGS